MALLHKAVCVGLQQCHAGLARFLLADRWKTADLLLGHTLAHTNPAAYSDEIFWEKNGKHLEK